MIVSNMFKQTRSAHNGSRWPPLSFTLSASGSKMLLLRSKNLKNWVNQLAISTAGKFLILEKAPRFRGCYRQINQCFITYNAVAWQITCLGLTLAPCGEMDQTE